VTDTLAAALGHGYRVERRVGQGGMATVYLAEDLKHDRKVAVKVLRPELAAVIGAERFLREIKTVATLQHPHILGLIDSGVVDGTAYYVMPFVEGESLRDRLEREKQLPIADAVRIAGEVAAALDYAHRHGVIHRDIKPENILLHDGSALVADFGIALAASKGGGARMTETGMSLGTPHYMSPEQAMGEREITARSDVYALGAMTYEMLVGDPPFTGSTAQAVVAKVMTERPRRIRVQRDTVPSAIEDAVLTALEKLPADRFATAAQFAEALHAPSDTGRTRISNGGWRARLRDPLVLGLGALAAVLAVGLLVGQVQRSAPPPAGAAGVVRFVIPAPPSGSTNALGYNIMSVSPDGRTLVYVGQGEDRRQRLMVRTLDDIGARPLPGTEDAAFPIFSPDGKWVAFIRGNQIYKIAVDGNAPQTLGMAPGTFNGASWSATGIIVVSGNTALYVLPESGGEPRQLGDRGQVRGELYRDAPLVVDADGIVIYSSWSTSAMTGARIAIASLATGEATVLDVRGIQPLGLVDGNLLYVTSAGSIMGVPIDLAGRRVLGPAVQLVDNVVLNNSTGLARAALSRNTLFYQSGSQISQVVLAGPGGAVRTLLGDRRDYAFPRLSPDGQRLAVTMGVSGRRDVWLHEFGSGTLTRLTTEGTTNERPEWSPDGKRVLYRSDHETRTSIWWRPADLSGGRRHC
jgi:serine/threonine-protein kinase